MLRRFVLTTVVNPDDPGNTERAVVEGVQFTDGTCALRRILAAVNATQAWNAVDEAVTFFNDNGENVTLVWIDERSTPDGQA